MVSIEDEPLKLPLRPNLSKDANSIRAIALKSNHFEFVTTGSKKNIIYCYSYSIEPAIEQDARKLRYMILDGLKKEIEKDLGKFLISGWMIFSTIKKENPIVKQGSKINAEPGGQYSISIKLVEERDIGGISSLKKEPVLQFFNILIKKAIRDNNLMEIGKNSKYYDVRAENIKVIKKHNIEVMRGFKTATDVYKDGLFTLIDFSSRVLRTESVLEYIKSCEVKGFKRKEILDELQYTSCLAKYGNYTMWRIDDIKWHLTPSEKYKIKGEEISLIDYYRQRYNIIIQKPDQPLLFHKHRKTGQEFYLVPELLYQTGLSDNLKNDHQVMKDLAEFTKLDPQTRMREHIYDLAEKLNKSLPKIIDNVKLDVASNNVKGRILEEPQIITGGGKTLNAIGGNFALNCPVIEPANLKNWAIIYHKNDYDNCDRLYNLLKKCAGNLAINVTEPIWIECESKHSKDWEAALTKQLGKLKDIMILVALISPFEKKALYPTIKKFTCNTKPMPSQVVITKSLHKNKNEMSVCSKILLQMNAKIGLSLWQTQLPKGLPAKTMIIGTDVSHNVGPKSNKKSVVGFCASLDVTFTKFYTQVHFQDKPGEEFISTIPNLVKKALNAYFIANKKTLPDFILFYRDGVGETQKTLVQTIELEAILKVMTPFYGNNKPPLAYFIVTKKINDRFFTSADASGARSSLGRGGYGGPKSGLVNPPSGTIVSDKVVSKNFDFFLIAQNVTQGTCTPTRYECIYNNTEILEDVFWKITYYQCFNYYNWSGAIRVPACAMYTKKAGFMVGQALTENPDESLSKSLYFL